MALAKIGRAANSDFLGLALVVFEHGLPVVADGATKKFAADELAGQGEEFTIELLPVLVPVHDFAPVFEYGPVDSGAAG